MRASVVVLALCMLLTGTINTIATKYQDIIVIGYGPDGTPITFRHPAVQSACMFLGESLCLIPYFIMRWRRRKAKRRDPAYVPMPAHEKRSRRIGRIVAFAVPTLCDATGTSLMNIGLFYTYASTYQMLRGTLVLFAGAFTVLILRRQLFIHHWLGMVLITAGAALVGASSVLYQDHPGSSNGGLGLSTGGLMHPAGWATAAGTAASAPGGSWQAAGQQVVGLLLNATAAGLHYDPGVSRVASRGMLGMMPQLGAVAAPVAAAVGSTSNGGTSSAALGGGVVSVDPFAAGNGLRPGVVPGLHVWSAALREGGGDVAAAPLFGDLLVVGAQMFTALQFILEEKFLVKYKVPALLAVGLEGCWGLVLCAFLLPVTTLLRGPDGQPLDDAPAALRAIWSNLELGGAVYLSIFSIAFFNFFGVSVTKSLSGAARATIDACRTVFIWLYALHAGWESFHALEVVGFVVLISGTSLYNEIIKSCLPGTSIESGRQTPLPRHSRSRRPRSSGSARDSAAGGGASDGAALRVPLLQGEADAEKGPTAAAAAAAAGVVLPGAAPAAAAAGTPAGRGRTAPPVPLRRPAPAHSRAAAAEAAQSMGGSGSWAYHMARSMRLGIHTLSPQSLAAAGGLAEGDDGEEGDTSDVEGDESVSESGSSYYSGSFLGGNSLGRSMEGGVLGGLSSGSLRGAAGSSGRGGALAAYADGSGGASSSGVMVLRGFEGAAAGGGSSSGLSNRPQAAAAVGVGGLTASLQQAGGGGSRLRAASPAAGAALGTPPLPRQPSSGTLRRQSSSGNVRTGGGGSSQQQQQQQ